jgi:hypothetical protein
MAVFSNHLLTFSVLLPNSLTDWSVINHTKEHIVKKDVVTRESGKKAREETQKLTDGDHRRDNAHQ